MTDDLSNDQALLAGQEIVSQNGRYRLVMQGDGNLVGYSPGYPFWDTGTWNLPASMRPDRAIMQADGNLVLYTPSAAPVWATDTWGNPGARLVMQDDRNLVIYRQDGAAIWASNTTNVPGVEIPVEVNQEVGYGKFVQVTGKLYRSGDWVASVYTRNGNLTGGLRGKVLVVVADEGGHLIWASQVRAEPTRCSLPDFSCASYGQTTWAEKFPEPIGRFADRVDVYAADTATFVDLRDQFIRVIKAGTDVAVEIKAAWDALVPSTP